MWDGKTLAGRCNTPLGVSSARHQSANPVADRQSGRIHGGRIARFDDTCHLQAGNIRRARRHRVTAGALQDVGSIHPTGCHANQHFTDSRHRILPHSRDQHLRRAGLLDFNDFHVKTESVQRQMVNICYIKNSDYCWAAASGLWGARSSSAFMDSLTRPFSSVSSTLTLTIWPSLR